MSRILVVQPHKMLQHAFSVALFPEHQVKIMERIPDAAALKDVDLVIVDALALRQRDSLAQQELSEVQNWKTPTIWIDKDADSQVPTRQRNSRSKKASSTRKSSQPNSERSGRTISPY
jgi:hypothetical protein